MTYAVWTAVSSSEEQADMLRIFWGRVKASSRVPTVLTAQDAELPSVITASATRIPSTVPRCYIFKLFLFIF